MRSRRLKAFSSFPCDGQNDLKTIVWTQLYFYCVFSEIQMQTFENASVWIKRILSNITN